jgi:hypothetical protein
MPVLRSKVASTEKSPSHGNIGQVYRMRRCTKCSDRHEAPTGRKCTYVGSSTKKTQEVNNQSEVKQIISRQLELMEVMAQSLTQNLEIQSKFPNDYRERQPNSRTLSTSPVKKRKVHDVDSSSEEKDDDSMEDSDSLEEDMSDLRMLKSGQSKRIVEKTRRRGLIARPKIARPVSDDDSYSSGEDMHSPRLWKSRYSQRIRKKARKSGLIPQRGQIARPQVGVSGRDRAVSKGKIIDIMWPHECLRRKRGKQVAYDELTIFEFIIGYVTIMEQQKPIFREAMASHLQALCRDASKFGWEATRDFHGIVLQEMELGQLGWLDQDDIQQLRIDELWHMKDSKDASKITKYCWAFQTGKCKHTGDHYGEKGDFYKHICGYCAKSGNAFRHSEQDCRNKLKSPAHNDTGKDKVNNGKSGPKN